MKARLLAISWSLAGAGGGGAMTCSRDSWLPLLAAVSFAAAVLSRDISVTALTVYTGLDFLT